MCKRYKINDITFFYSNLQFNWTVGEHLQEAKSNANIKLTGGGHFDKYIYNNRYNV